ncbi:hypothetical protein [Anaerostipes hadrus]|nr:hypothetical protein [Anaerostipes hadrus]
MSSYDPDWYITSNTESGDGYSDIMIEVNNLGLIEPSVRHG